MVEKLTLTLADGEVSKEGVSVAAVVAALEGVQDAMRLMVQHLAGRQTGPGRPSRWVESHNLLRIAATRAGSLVLDLDVDDEPDAWLEMTGVGRQAFDAFLKWDGTERSTLPKPVTDRLCSIPSKLPGRVQVWLGSWDLSRRVENTRKDRVVIPARRTEEALLHGWLKEVNWDKRTARLHDYVGGYVRLKFGPALDDEMLRLATRYVEVSGRGRFNDKGHWTTVQVEEISPTRSWDQPFDVNAFLNDPNLKRFDPENIVTASEPFDVDEFIQIVREGREVRTEERAE